MPTLNSKDTFNIVILYDEIAAGRLGMELYARLVRSLADECQPELSLWRFDIVATPEIPPEVNQNLTAADLILILGRSRQACPLRFWHGPDRTGQPEDSLSHVLVAFLEVSGEADPTSDARVELPQPAVDHRPQRIFEWEPHNSGSPFVDSTLPPSREFHCSQSALDGNKVGDAVFASSRPNS